MVWRVEELGWEGKEERKRQKRQKREAEGNCGIGIWQGGGMGRLPHGSNRDVVGKNVERGRW